MTDHSALTRKLRILTAHSGKPKRRSSAHRALRPLESRLTRVTCISHPIHPTQIPIRSAKLRISRTKAVRATELTK